MAYEHNLDAIFRPPICSSPSQSRNPSAYNAAIEFLDGAVIKSILIWSFTRIQEVILLWITFMALRAATNRTRRHTTASRFSPQSAQTLHF